MEVSNSWNLLIGKLDFAEVIPSASLSGDVESDDPSLSTCAYAQLNDDASMN